MYSGFILDEKNTIFSVLALDRSALQEIDLIQGPVRGRGVW